MEGLVGGIILILAFFYLLGIPSPSKEDVEKMESENPGLVFWQWAIILFGLFILGLGFSRLPWFRLPNRATVVFVAIIFPPLDPYTWARATTKENLCIQQSLQNFMEWLGSYLILELFCFCFLILFFPGLFKQQGKNMSNFEFTVGLFALVFLILIFFFPDLIEEIIWGGSWCLLQEKGRWESHDS